MVFVNRMVRSRRIGSRNVQKDFCSRILVENSGDEADPGVETGLQATVSTPVTFVTFTRLLRISLRFIAQIQSSFFPRISTDFPLLAFLKRRQTVIVFTASLTGNQAPHLFASNIH